MRHGGRPRRIELTDIVSAGVEIGLTDLSLAAVAHRLGVSTTALYRHVENRWGLETAVGEHLLSNLELHDDPDHDIGTQLLSFALQLYRFVTAHPGLAGYLQTAFPRGESGRRLLAAQTAFAEARGYSTEAAIVVSSAVASQAIGLAAADDARRGTDRGADDLLGASEAALAADERLHTAHSRLPQMSLTDATRLILSASVAGIVAAIPPGADITAVLTALDETSRDL